MTANGNSSDGDSTSKRSVGGFSRALSLVLPPDPVVLGEAIRLISDQNIRREDLANTLSQDPVLSLELIKEANSSSSRERALVAISTIQTAVTRLGTESCYKLLQNIGQRPLLQQPEQSRYLEQSRSRGKRVGLISRMIATIVARPLANEVHVAGVLGCFGEMLATLHLGDQYVKAAEDSQSRAGLVYKLAHDFKFDIEKITSTYLSLHGIPDSLLVAHDKEALARHKDRGIVRSVVAAASEIVDFFDAHRWEKLAPGKVLPSKSNIRLLQFSDQSQYRKLYERASEYLFSIRTIEAKQRALVKSYNATTAWESAEQIGAYSALAASPSGTGDGVEIVIEPHESDEESEKTSIAAEFSDANQIQSESLQELTQNDREILFEKFDLHNESRNNRARRTPIQQTSSSLPQLKLSNAQKAVSGMLDELRDTTSSEELIRRLLSILVDQGPFEKTALIVVSRDRRDAIVVASRGPIAGSGKRLSIEDPLSPLALCLSRVQSFGVTENDISPFGSKSFAIAPVDADHDTPVVLYADCGNDGTITFEARRIFRTVVELANQKLKEVSGGIPIELNF